MNFLSVFKAPLMAIGGFVWREHTSEILITALLSMVPTYEGRYAVPVAMAMGMPAIYAYLLTFLCSSVPVPFIFLLLRPILDWFYTLPIKPVQKFAAWLERHAEKKRQGLTDKKSSGISRFLSAETAELLGIYLFVAIPLPGTGVWTGSAIATLFEMPRAKSIIAILLGNATACLITMLITSGALAIL